MGNVIPRPINIVDFEDVQAEVSVTKNTINNVVLSVTTKNNLKAYFAFVGMAWDAPYNTFLTWRVKRNGATIFNLRDSKVQIAAPEQTIQELTPWIELMQGEILTFEVDVTNGAASSPANVAARFRIYYAALPDLT